MNITYSKLPNINKYRKSLSAKLAFTLAEVLIVIGIIGMIANMTIPALMAATQDLEFKSAAKKNYSEVTGVFNKILSDTGRDRLKFGEYATGLDLRTAFLPYFQYSKTCDAIAAKGTCWNSNGGYALDTKTQLNDDLWWFSGNNKMFALLNDGTSLSFDVNPGVYQCDSQQATLNAKSCGRVMMDVNGLKKPNIMGKDIYMILILPDKVVPNGECTVAASAMGMCSLEALLTGP